MHNTSWIDHTYANIQKYGVIKIVFLGNEYLYSERLH